MQKTKCRGCNEEISFVNYNGKKHPVNIKPRKVFVETKDFEGNSWGWSLLNGYDSHLETCTDSTHFRKTNGNHKDIQEEK